MKLKFKAIKKGRVFFYALVQTLTVISLSAYSWRPNIKFTSELNSNFVGYSFNDSQFTNSQTINEFTQTSIASTLAAIHTAFASKYSTAKNLYPPTLNDSEALLTTFVMQEITDPQNSFYSTLVKQIQNIILYNITTEVFYYDDNAIGRQFSAQGISVPSYLPDRRTMNLGDSYNSIRGNYVWNTLTKNEQETKITTLLNKMKTYLTKSKNSYGMNWYSEIPQQLKIKKGFNQPISNQSYTNLIDAITTNKMGGKIVDTGYQLKDLQTEINQLLKTQMDADMAKIKAAVQDKSTPIFLDETPQQLASVFNFAPLQIQAFSLQLGQWNYYFSQSSLVKLNPKVLTGELSNLRSYSLKFFYGSDNSNKIEKPKISSLLALYNAFYPSDFSNSSSLLASYYENDQQGDAKELLEKLFNFIKSDVTQNFNSYFVFKESSKNKLADTIERNDYEKTAKLKNLENLLNLKLDFIREQSEDSKVTNFTDKTWTAKVTLNLSSNDNLSNPKYHKSETFNVAVIQEKNQAQADFENALELDPIFQRQFGLTPKKTIISQINQGVQKYFKFNNLVTSLNYKTISAEETKNGDIKLTIEITSKLIPNLKKTYQKTINKNLLSEPDNFDIKAHTEAQKINTAIRQEYGDEIYNAKMNSNAEELLFQNVLSKTKSSEGFSNLSSEAKLDLFKKNYQAALLALLLNETTTPKDELTEKINNHYKDLSNRLDTLLKQAGISPDSKLAKSLKEQLAKAHANALADKGNFNENSPKDQELTDILNILDSKNMDQNLLNNFGKFIEKYNYNDIQKVLNETQKSVLYSVSGLAGIILLGSSYLMFRSMKIDAERFRIRKSMLGSLAGFLILASGASLIYLIVYLLGAI